jgi:hypothetical protein
VSEIESEQYIPKASVSGGVLPTSHRSFIART